MEFLKKKRVGKQWYPNPLYGSSLALIQELLQIRALYWLNTLFAVKF